jgi:hypothetical protein
LKALPVVIMDLAKVLKATDRATKSIRPARLFKRKLAFFVGPKSIDEP